MGVIRHRQRNADISGAASLLLVPLQEFLATPNTSFQLVASRGVDPPPSYAQHPLGSSRQAQPLGCSLLSACLSRKDLGSPLGFLPGFFASREAGTRRFSPAPGGSQPPVSPLRGEMLEGERGEAGPVKALSRVLLSPCRSRGRGLQSASASRESSRFPTGFSWAGWLLSLLGTTGVVGS